MEMSKADDLILSPNAEDMEIVQSGGVEASGIITTNVVSNPKPVSPPAWLRIRFAETKR